MKILFASDLHGSAAAARKILSRCETEKADRLILLGDLLYHGPRNDLPEEYAPREVAALLNDCPLKPIGVRGNCDAEIDQMILNFPMMPDYMLLPLDDRHCAFVTHGHLFNTENPPPHHPGDVLVHGHTHVHGIWPADDYTYINPGSAALPKEQQQPTYMIFENGVFSIRDLQSGNELLRFDIK